MTRALFDKALTTAAELAQSIPAQREFINWPRAMPFTPRTPNPVPAIDELEKHPGEANALTQGLQQALMALARHVEWRLTYTEAEVGKDFLRRYGWFELAGPQDGYFQTDQTRMTVGYWGPNLDYPWHLHEAEELYLVVSGQATFEAEGQEPRTLRAGDTIYHRSNQPHAMTTHESGILTFVLWRGAGLSDAPRMGD
jgi:mannose-6-phosphate isomerase-like protein (cupin superfamily)